MVTGMAEALMPKEAFGVMVEGQDSGVGGLGGNSPWGSVVVWYDEGRGDSEGMQGAAFRRGRDVTGGTTGVGGDGVGTTINNWWVAREQEGKRIGFGIQKAAIDGKGG